jgi:copper chaperone CopZ
MVKEYNITGMTCGGCVTKVKKQLESYSGIDKVEVRLESPQAKIWAKSITDSKVLNEHIQLVGNYSISNFSKEISTQGLADKTISTYKPLILIVFFIAMISAIVQYHSHHFDFILWMRHFMAGFFIVFSFFKLLNLKGFADSYAMYDVVAIKWNTWGLIYPFVELGLGICYLINVFPFEINVITILILGVSSIGVIKSNIDKKKIKCACLGDVFNLPMSTVTIMEDLTMVAMAIVMLYKLT